MRGTGFFGDRCRKIHASTEGKVELREGIADTLQKWHGDNIRVQSPENNRLQWESPTYSKSCDSHNAKILNIPPGTSVWLRKSSPAVHHVTVEDGAEGTVLGPWQEGLGETQAWRVHFPFWGVRVLQRHQFTC